MVLHLLTVLDVETVLKYVQRKDKAFSYETTRYST